MLIPDPKILIFWSIDMIFKLFSDLKLKYWLSQSQCLWSWSHGLRSQSHDPWSRVQCKLLINTWVYCTYVKLTYKSQIRWSQHFLNLSCLLFSISGISCLCGCYLSYKPVFAITGNQKTKLIFNPLNLLHIFTIILANFLNFSLSKPSALF